MEDFLATVLPRPVDAVGHSGAVTSGDSRMKKWGGHCGAKEKVGGPT